MGFNTTLQFIYLGAVTLLLVVVIILLIYNSGRNTHKRVGLILEATPIASLMWDKKLNLFECNSAALGLFRLDSKKDFFKRDKIQEALERALAEGRYVFKMGHTLSDGTKLSLEATLVRVKYGNEDVILGFVKDLREQERILNELNEANQSKINFLTNMSHEMRTPLNTVIGLADIELRNGNLDDNSKLHLKTIEGEGENLLKLINDISDISKIDAGEFEITNEIYDTPGFINESITDNIRLLKTKPVKFILNIDKDFPANLIGDRRRIKQILDNLLSNAFTQTEEGEVKLNISSLCKDEDVWITIAVSDTSEGIKADEIDKIFIDYIQMENAANHKIEGTGLILPITKKLVETMNGTIAVESVFGVGSKFIVKIKQKYASGDIIGIKVVENLRNFRYSDDKRKEKTIFDRIRLPYAHVLMVDDNIVNLEISKGLVKPYGMQIDCVTSGAEAIDVILNEEIEYDAIFMDYMMPGINGLEATEKIRGIGTEYAKNIPIIALTANAEEVNEQVFLNNGFQAFLMKPINISDLDAVIRLWVRDESKENRMRDISIEGIKLNHLLSHIDNDGIMLEEVLRIYAGYTKQQIEKIRQVNRENLDDYAITVHGIKGSSRGVYAEEIGKKAESLEEAAKAGDMEFINDNNPGFIESVEKLINDISNVFDKIDVN